MTQDGRTRSPRSASSRSHRPRGFPARLAARLMASLSPSLALNDTVSRRPSGNLGRPSVGVLTLAMGRW